MDILVVFFVAYLSIITQTWIVQCKFPNVSESMLGATLYLMLIVTSRFSFLTTSVFLAVGGIP